MHPKFVGPNNLPAYQTWISISTFHHTVGDTSKDCIVLVIITFNIAKKLNYYTETNPLSK